MTGIVLLATAPSARSTKTALHAGPWMSASSGGAAVSGRWEWTAEWYAGLGAANTSVAWPTDATHPYNNDGTWNIASSAWPGGTGPVVGLPAAALRGGYWDDGTSAGVFALALDYGPSYWHAAIGFRCVAR